VGRAPDEITQVLSLAIALEQRCALLYVGWAHRFAPYDTEICHLLRDLAEEEQSHALEFQRLRNELVGGGVAEEMSLPPEFVSCLERLRTIEHRFFVTGPLMATTILDAALEIEFITARFYRDLESKMSNAVLAETCRRLSEIEDEHGRSISRRLESERQKIMA